MKLILINMYSIGQNVKIVDDKCFHGEKIGEVVEIVRITIDVECHEYRYYYKGGRYGHNGFGNYLIDIDIRLSEQSKSLKEICINNFLKINKI